VSAVKFRRPFPFGEAPAYVAEFFGRIAGCAAISIGNICNQRCIYCDTHRDPLLYLTAADARERVDRIVGLGLKKLMFVGGEPTIWRELPSLVAYARGAGLREVVVTTNGLMLAYREYLQRLLDAGMTDMQLSCDSFAPETMRSLSSNDRADELLTRAIDHLVETSGARFFLNAVVSRPTRPQLLDYVRRVAELSARCGRPIAAVFSHLKPITYAHDNREVLAEPLSVAAPAILEALQHAWSLGQHVVLKGLQPCQIRGFEATSWEANIIEYRIDLETGAELPPIQSPWMTKGARCAECHWEPHCSGVYKNYVDEFGWDEFVPVARPPAAVDAGRA
jgi:organic radical activating enzyme